MVEETVRVDSDEMVAMIVGHWAQKKHEFLCAYIDATRRARKKFGYSSYIDLFCGPGRVVEKHSNVFRDGGAVAAWKASLAGGVPFSKVFIGDLDADSVSICKRRLEKLGALVRAFVGPASRTVDDLIAELPTRGLHLAFLDPFNAQHLDFKIIERLASRPNIDILVHFSVMDISRNIDLEAAKEGTRLDVIGPGWRQAIDLRKLPKDAFLNAFLDYWQTQVQDFARLKAADQKPLFVNSNNGPLYRLILLSRHPLAEKIWNDVGRADKGQKNLF
jgi:three-Cys-motif partner protein